MEKDYNLRRIDIWAAEHRDYFNGYELEVIKNRLYEEDSNIVDSILMTVELKNPTILFIFSILLGGLGVDRFMLGDIKMGILKIVLNVTVVGEIAIWIYDMVKIKGKTRTYNFKKMMNILG